MFGTWTLDITHFDWHQPLNWAPGFWQLGKTLSEKMQIRLKRVFLFGKKIRIGIRSGWIFFVSIWVKNQFSIFDGFIFLKILKHILCLKKIGIYKMKQIGIGLLDKTSLNTASV